MDSFSSSDRQGFDIWISNRLDEKHSWEEIENLCFIYIYMYVDFVSYIKPEF